MTSGPTGRRDESVQFSLKGLLELEDERLEEQARAGEAREAAALRVKHEETERQLAEAEARTRAESEARGRDRSAELDQLARREAMQKAIVEQARLEVDVRARAEERERERRHELEVERLRGQAKQGAAIGPLLLAAGLGGVVSLAVILGVHFGVSKPATDRHAMELAHGIAIAEERVAELGRQGDEQRGTIRELQGRLAAAQAELTTASHGTTVPTKKMPPRAPHDPPPPAAETKVICELGDPLCPAIPRSR